MMTGLPVCNRPLLSSPHQQHGLVLPLSTAKTLPRSVRNVGTTRQAADCPNNRPQKSQRLG